VLDEVVHRPGARDLDAVEELQVHGLWRLIHFAGIDQVAISVRLNCEFVVAGALGVPVYGPGAWCDQTKSMVFVQGQLNQDDQPILMFSSVARRITQRINVG
jgi:acyl-coenzyme A thioesterase PaaI-like protein